ncbi:hypothetical protein L873DRAFT_1795153 [Choiromyces venosus 120613-1]|uniref:Uncharacterized protein n=1 Tax=Choiromyces venosus 120613-1 TaxID=1336337 RepID=A0A3N4J3K2_9PEZI|nr:hypothetical protein L873DRAFT_1795153 [Choiromyces venosus 120613-1]
MHFSKEICMGNLSSKGGFCNSEFFSTKRFIIMSANPTYTSKYGIYHILHSHKLSLSPQPTPQPSYSFPLNKHRNPQDLQNLERLSLILIITTELSNYLGIDNKTLAEFLINLHQKSSLPAEFKKIIASHGIEFSDSLIMSIDQLVFTMHPKYKDDRNKRESGDDGRDGKGMDLDTKARMFKVLALPDREAPPVWEEEDGEEKNGNKGKEPNTIDDMMALLEDLGPKSKEKRGGGGAKGDALAFLEGRGRNFGAEIGNKVMNRMILAAI